MLEQVADEVWAAAIPHRFLGAEFGARMSVVRLADGSLWVHSPLPRTPELAAAVDALGPVRHVVAPNRYHHLWAGQWVTPYAGVELHGAPGLAKKRKDLRFDSTLGDDPHPAWEGQLEQVQLAGTVLLETVFLHVASRTVISCDLTCYIRDSPHWWTRWFFKLGGCYGRPGLTRWLKWTAFGDKPKVRAAIDRILAWDFERVIIAHGEIVTEDAVEAVRRTYDFVPELPTSVPQKVVEGPK